MENQKPNIVQHAMKFGFIMGLFNILVQLAIYLIDKALLVSFSIGIITMIINLILVIYPVRLYRKELEGFISFKEAFIIGLIVFAGSGLITIIFQYLLYNLIDPQLPDYIKEKAIEKTVGLMERFGAGQEEIAKAIEPLEKEDFHQTPSKLGSSYLSNVLIGAVLSLVIAALTRKAPKNSSI
ncbi:MAG: DUF4199 domain-containing protein [Bacteroidota bacterium]|jgi:hypothetical protein|nr:DUF4199 domain-containing protein [Sphingobacteriales bacterium]